MNYEYQILMFILGFLCSRYVVKSDYRKTIRTCPTNSLNYMIKLMKKEVASRENPKEASDETN